jgi:hypothetical protein
VIEGARDTLRAAPFISTHQLRTHRNIREKKLRNPSVDALPQWLKIDPSTTVPRLLPIRWGASSSDVALDVRLLAGSNPRLVSIDAGRYEGGTENTLAPRENRQSGSRFQVFGGTEQSEHLVIRLLAIADRRETDS